VAGDDGAIARGPASKAIVPVKVIFDIPLTHFATAGDYYYWIESSPSEFVVNSENAANGVISIETVATQMGQAKALAAGGGAVFWSAVGSSAIRWVPTKGEQPVEFAKDDMDVNPPTVLAFRDGYLYWSWIAAGGIERKGTGDVTSSYVTSTGTSTVAGIAVDSTDVYYSTQGSVAGAIRAVPKGGDIAGKDFGVAPSMPTHIAVDEGYVYWIDLGNSQCIQNTASFWRVSKTTLEPKEIASGFTCPSNFVQDNDYIYFGSGKELFRFPKKT
jgi:hypothetical protein